MKPYNLSLTVLCCASLTFYHWPLCISYNYNLFMPHNLKFKNLSLKKDFQVALADLWLLNKPSSEGYTGSTIIVQHFSSVQFSS